MDIDRLKGIERALVVKNGVNVGTLERTTHGAVFRYDPKWSGDGIAYSMPPTRSEYAVRGENLHPFFANLLPEGRRLTALVKAVKTSADDLFSLFIAAGSDTIGDVSVQIEGAPKPRDLSVPHDLSQVNFLELFERSISASTVEERARDVSTSGVQPKVSAAMISFPVSLWKRGPSLLKLDPPEYPGLVKNEHFFLTAAKLSGLNTPDHAIVHDRDGKEGLLVKRFDRILKRGASIGSIHQEDGCQLLDRYPSEKYRISTSVLVEALCNVVSAPIIETLSFLRLLAFSYLIGNGDLHAKNVSVATDPKSGRIRLTPAYDLVSTIPYGDTKMALEFEGRTDNISRSDFIAFAGRFDLRAPAVEAMLDEVLAATTEWRPRLEELALPSKRLQQLSKLIDKRTGDLTYKRKTTASSRE